jgi:uncharacterized membrane protein
MEDRVEVLERRVARLERLIEGPSTTASRTAAPARVRQGTEAPSARPRQESERIPVAAPRVRRERQHAASPRRPATPRRPVAPPRPKKEINVEDLLGGRVLAWLGGVAVLVGVAFFFALAISHGWIGPAARVLIAGAGALGLLGAGIWLHDKKGRTDAALAAVSTAVAGLFATVTVAAQVYELVPAVVGLILAAAIGTAATALALRWEAKGIAALGIGGCLLAPVLVGAPATATSILFLLIAGAAAAGVMLWQRWDWLAFGAFAISTPQWIAWLLNDPSLGIALLVMSCFGALGVASAIGFELRKPSAKLRPSAPFLLALNALVLATVGWFWMVSEHHHTAGQIWLVALAVLHIGMGLAERRVGRISHEIGLLSLVLGVVLADVAYGLIVSGPAQAAGWAAGAFAFAVIGKRSSKSSPDHLLAQVGLGAHVALALIRALVVDAPPSAIGGDSGSVLAAAVALSALAAACFGSARMAQEGRPEWRIALDSLGLAALAYLTAIALDGPAVAIAWAVEAGALAQLVRHSKDQVGLIASLAFLAGAAFHLLIFDANPATTVDGVHNLLPVAGCVAAVSLAALRIARTLPDPISSEALDGVAIAALAYFAAVALDGVLLVASWTVGAVALAEVARRTKRDAPAYGALALTGLAGIHASAFEAPLRSLVYGVDHLAAAAGALLLVAAATMRMAQLGTGGEKQRVWLGVAVAVTLLYAASVAVVSAFQPGSAAATLSVFDLGPRQQAQLVLSVLWSVVGVAALLIGLRSDVKPLRIGALALLLTTVGKVFLYDLSALTSVYRVASFVGLGLLLLAGAFAWQRMRPRALPDLREVPKGVR